MAISPAEPSVIDEVKDGQSPLSGQRPRDTYQRARALKLTSSNRINHEADLGLE
jgi:hypothetical protein